MSERPQMRPPYVGLLLGWIGWWLLLLLAVLVTR
jgi:hypothetical protein